MEELMGLFILALAIPFLAAPIVAILALVRVSRLQRRVQQTEQFEPRLTGVEAGFRVTLRRIDALEKRGGPTEAAAAGAAEPARPAAAPPEVPSSVPPPLPATESARPAETPQPAVAPPPVVISGTVAPAAPAAATAEPKAPPPPPAPSPQPKLSIDWERWIGIRGAALLGAIALGLAGLLFFKYSIERGLITPLMRVVLGTLTGLGCLAGSDWLRRRDYRHTAEALAGAGVVVLYAAFWAAHILYGLIGMPISFGLMLLVTVICCVLAVRRKSLTIAVLGLVGGFATPLLLTSGADQPIGLFGYVLLLDLGLLLVGHKRRWPLLGILSLLGTVLLQTIWIGGRMGPERLFLGLAIVTLFGALFVFAGRLGGEQKARGALLWTRLGGVLFPFAFALYFASRVELGSHLYPIAMLLALLCAAAGWLAREQRQYAIGAGAATASLAVVAVWSIQHSLTAGLAWELVAVVTGLTVIFHFFVEREPERSGINGPAPAALIALGGFWFLLSWATAWANVAPWPSLAGGALFALLAYRHAGFPGRGALQLGGAAGLGFNFSLLHLSPRTLLPPDWLFLGLLVAAPLLLHAAALGRREPALRRFAEQAAALLPILLLVGLAPSEFTHSLPPLAALGCALTLGLLALLAAARLGQGMWIAAAAGATLLVDLVWISARDGLRGNPAESLAALVVMALGVVLFTAWPFVGLRRASPDRVAWYTAVLAGPLWFLPLREMFEWRFGDAAIGLLPVALGGLSLAAALQLRKLKPEPATPRHAAFVGFAAVALCFLALAIPLQLDREWITIGWAVQGLAVLALWKRLDHPGLKYFGLALLGAATLRLVANPALLAYYPRSTVPIVNWLLYTYLVPAAALLGSAALLRPFETGRARPWERSLYAQNHPVGAICAGLSAIFVIFVWINLAIADWFATGPVLTLSFGDRPAQRLTVSIAWAVYALLLLGSGMARKSLGLRWLSLGFLLITIGKVFLYDLGALKDLYRVGSLIGLALSLILVSLAYQRFVFRGSGEDR